MYRKQVRRRRAVLLLLVAASLTLLSLYYREGNGGPIHGARTWSRRLQPDRVRGRSGAEARPRPRQLVRRDLRRPRRQGSKLQDQVASLRDQLARSQTQQHEAKELSALNELTSGGIVPDGTDAGHGAGGRPLARPSGTRR